MLILVRKRLTDWISKLSNLDIILEILDNRNEFEAYAENAELSALDEFEIIPVEFEPYGED